MNGGEYETTERSRNLRAHQHLGSNSDGDQERTTSEVREELEGVGSWAPRLQEDKGT